MVRILVVEDDPRVRRVMVRAFDRADFVTHAVDHAKDALDVIERETIDVLVCDVKIPGLDGYRLVNHITHARPQVAALLITGFPGHSQERARRAGARMLLSKPVIPEELVAHCRRIARERVAEGGFEVVGCTGAWADDSGSANCGP